MNAISSGVALLAAKMMSPSFSRFSSSTTTTALPAAMSAIARSMLSSLMLVMTGPVSVRWSSLSPIVLDVLGDDVGLEVHPSPGCRKPRVVRARVSGIRETVNPSARTSTTVSEMPSTVIEPFGTR